MPIPLTAILALALALPAAAAAGTTSDRIYSDCEHSPTGYLTGHYSKRALREALNNPPADVSEYSGCYDAIRQALLATNQPPPGNGSSGGGPGAFGGIGGGTTPGGTGGGSGTGAATAPAHVGTKAPVALAGTTVAPGTIPAIGRDARGLPTPLVVLLVLLGAVALAAATTTIGRRVIAHRRA